MIKLDIKKIKYCKKTNKIKYKLSIAEKLKKIKKKSKKQLYRIVVFEDIYIYLEYKNKLIVKNKLNKYYIRYLLRKEIKEVKRIMNKDSGFYFYLKDLKKLDSLIINIDDFQLIFN